MLFALLVILIGAAIFINSEWGQNFIAGKVTGRLSRDLKTKIEFKHISLSLFNKMTLEGFLVEDQQKDTLLYAGNLQVRITDWFFFKDKIVLHYVGLQDAVIDLNRADSIWNYQYLADYFSGGGSSGGGKGALQLDLKKIDLKRVSIRQKDAWRGQDMLVKFDALTLDADEINFATRKATINEISLLNPLFSIKDYQGRRPKSVSKNVEAEESDTDKKNEINVSSVDSLLKWNAAGWLVQVDKLKIRDGIFSTERPSSTPYDDFFDGRHIVFSEINATFKDLKLTRDTLTTSVDLQTKERSGFIVKSFLADAKFTPQQMAFDKLEIKTNNSVIRDYFSMNYDDISDMSDFIHKVKMQAHFEDADIDSDDIAYFAPALKTWKKKIRISGNSRGTVDDLFANDMIIEAGANTLLNGDISLTGLPDINKTFIDFKANTFKTNYADASTFLPSIRNITTPRLQNISYLSFNGSFTGFIKDFVTYGTIRTNLGTITSDLNMKLPEGKLPFYSGNIASQNFMLGQFMNNPELGNISFSAQVKGKGFAWNNIDADVDTKIGLLEYNQYRYQNIIANGSLINKIFTGEFSIADSNAVASLNGVVDLSDTIPRFNFLADVGKLNLQPLNITRDNFSFKGKLDFNFSSNSFDNFLGFASITNAEISNGRTVLPIDSLTADAKYVDGKKQMLINSRDLQADFKGDFSLADLPDAFNYFLHQYYPSFVKVPVGNFRQQAFDYTIKTGYISEYLRLFDTTITGFNNTEINGKINTRENQLELSALVPELGIRGYQFQNIKIDGRATEDGFSLTSTIDHLGINDSVGFPYTKLQLSARNDSTKINLVTRSNSKALPTGNINALVTTYEDGLTAKFDTSHFLINGKTWSLEKDGELEIRSKNVSRSEIVLKESNQEVRIKTQPSDIGNWNDIKVELKNFNVGDVTSLLVKSNKIQGLVNGDITIEDPVKTFNVVSDLRTEQLYLDSDSLGNIKAHVLYENKTGKLSVKGNNLDPNKRVDFDANMFLKKLASNEDDVYSVSFADYPVNIAERFIGNLFTDLEGSATGQLKISGKGNNMNYVGKIKLHDGGLRVLFTQCFYKLTDTEIDFRDDEMSIGNLKLIDTVTKNTASLTSSIIKHHSWRNLQFNIKAKVDNKPMLVLNTGMKDNSSFYGNVKGTGTFSLTGPQSDMRLDITGEASRTDSSYVTIVNSNSRESGIADFLIEKKYGKELNDTSTKNRETNLTYFIDLTGNQMVNVKVVLDDLTNDEIRGRGDGNLRIVSATNEPMTIRGRYNIREGNYRFTFQSFFKKPFELKKEAGNYIEWNGDPYHPNISIEAVYKTDNKVDFSPLLSYYISSSGNTPTTVRDFVYVIAKLKGDLMKPSISFDLDFPPESPPKTDVSVAFVVDQLKNNEDELNKQVAFLVVFNSFAPIDAASTVGVSSGVDLVFSSISDFLSSQINNVLNNILSQKLKIPGLYVNFSGSLYNPKPFNTETSNLTESRTNLNLSVAKTLMNNRIVLTFEGNYDAPLQNTSTQTKSDILTNVTTEFLINKSGTIRATVFYKENLDYLYNSTSSSTNNKIRRVGTSLTYRRDFDKLKEIFSPKKKPLPPPAELKKEESEN